ncbi:DUF2203 domain-containing protein [Sulfobacillus harzensis]|uniref:DUF2203 domain-containing protein n=1 Tax=Sulfobacillus harzensis TaxID=2729629 RepID=A0A7Y0L3Y4_9FIRM|nr:DUF2203 domain-containing protein [Sulfobacillus harzensis]NMP22851.1 DUF2203 domain-containing protein [Sulfobacillus harzensis]
MERQFTIEEANQLIAVLRKDLEELKRLQHEARQKYEEMRDIREVGYRSDGNLIMLSDYQETKREFDRIVASANTILTGINQRGCRVTDVETGLVDFPAEVEGQPVYLCWQKDEPEVGYYHGLEEGFAGRRPLPQRFNPS